MRLGVLILFLALFSSEASAQRDAASPQRPSSFETVARGAEARIFWSQEIGRLEVGDSRAVFTALAVEDPAQRDRRIRGVRIDFSVPGWKSAVYIDEATLRPLKKISDQLSIDIERTQRLHPTGTGEGYIGSCEFRDNPGAYPLQVDYCYSGWCSPALRVFAPELMMFPGRKPSDLSEILASAIDQLKSR